MMPNPDPAVIGKQNPTQVIQQLAEVLKSPPSTAQNQQIVAILKANPSIAAFLKLKIDQKQKQPLQPMQQQMLLNERNMTGNPTMKPCQALINQILSIAAKPTQAPKQLLETLKSPPSTQQPQEIKVILKASPPLVATFITEKSAQKQQNKQQVLLNEGNMVENQTVSPHKVLPNPDLSIQKPANAWDQFVEALKSPSSAEQQQKVLSILKANPPLMKAFIKQRTAQKQQTPEKKLLEQQQQRQTIPDESNMIGNPKMRPHQVLSNPDLPMQKPTQAWNQLVETLKSPSSAEQQQKVLSILKANPPLMKAFIKQRTAQKQKIPEKKLLEQQQQRQAMLDESNMIGNRTMRLHQESQKPALSAAGVPNPSPAWKQLLESLKSPSARQQQKVLAILKANPQLIADFMKERTAQKQQQKQGQMSLNAGTPNVETGYQELLLTRRNSYVTIEAKRRKFNCHKCILGARFPVYAEIEHDLKRKASGIVTIEDSEPTAFQEFLLYLYTGSKKYLSWKNIMDRYKLANKYCVGDLEKICAEYIKNNITTENFYDFFLLSQMHNDREIIDIATLFFLENSKKITASKKWVVFLAENPVECNELIKALESK